VTQLLVNLWHNETVSCVNSKKLWKAAAWLISEQLHVGSGTFLSRDAMQKSGRLTVSVIRSSVMFVYSVKTNKRIFNFFHHRVAISFEFFPTKCYGNIPRGTLLTRALNADGAGKNHDSRPILSDFNVCCQRCDRQVWQQQRRGKLVTLIAVKRRRLFSQETDDEVFMTRSQPYAEDNVTEFNLTQ